MAHLALYREWRPQTFGDVVGQQHITRTLRRAVSQSRLAHAYLLCGPRGTGKTSVARLLAKAANCLQATEGEPCNTCQACTMISAGRSMDIIEVDAASNRGIDEIRDMRDKVRYSPADLSRKVYIIDEVHMLTEPAFNALLKTLEEPPAHVMFILATTEPHKVPVTILSRCQRYDFHRLNRGEIIGRLQQVCRQQGAPADPDVLSIIAGQAEGGMRDALSLLDQVLTYADAGMGITLDDALAVLGVATQEQFVTMAEALLAGDMPRALVLLDQVVRQGKDLRQFVRDFLGYLRDLLLVKVGALQTLTELPEAMLTTLQAQAGTAGSERIVPFIHALAETEGQLRTAPNPRLLVEVALIRLTMPGTAAIPASAPALAPTAVPATGMAPTAAGATTASTAGDKAAFDIPRPTAEPATRRGTAGQGGGAAAAHAPPTPPTGAGERDALVLYQELWPEVLELFSGKNHLKPFQALLREGRPIRLSGKTLTIGFPPSYTVHREKVADKHDWVEKALEHLGHPGLRVAADFTLESQPAPAPAAGPEIAALLRQRLGDVQVIEVQEEESR